MNTAVDLPNLHDAVLERIELKWEEGLVTIELTRVPGGVCTLTASGLREFTMSRRQEWGPSACVNRAEVREDGENGIVLEIEMQSGDTITVAADRLATPS
jgi:hypothetical protein